MYKRKIKVPTAKFGDGIKRAQSDWLLANGGTDGLTTGLIGLNNLSNNTIGSAVELLASTGGRSTATTGGQAVTDSITGIAKSAGTGMKIGSAFGPIGAVAGAGIGAAIGLVGKRGEGALMTSFTDYDEGTLGTGLIGAFSNKRLRNRRRRIRMNAMLNRDAVRGTEYLASEYENEYGDLDDYTFADGGITHSLAYVDDGELISTPDGSINKVPERGNPTDSNLISLPIGSKILSDSLKAPSTNKTFAELGEEMMTKRKSKNNDIYALNAARLNEMNNKTIHDQLFELLEQVKANKGIKRKYKNTVIAAAPGDEIRPWAYGDNFKYLQNGQYDEGYLNFMRNGLTQDMVDRAFTERPDLFTRFTAANHNYRPTVEQASTWGTDYKPSDFHRFGEYLYDNRTRLRGVPRFTPGTDVDEEAVSALGSIPVSRAATSTQVEPEGANIESGDSNSGNNTTRRNWWDVVGNALTSLGELSPALSNIFTSRPHPVSANYNPYANAIRNTMGGRRFNIQPMIRDIQRNRAISNYNADLMNTNTGANLAFRLANANNTYNAIANARATENNYNNQYAAEYANAMNDLGQQWVNATNYTEDLNRRNYANARNIRRTGYSQLSQWLQQRRADENQRLRDNAMLTLYEPYLQAGYTAPTLSDYYRWIRRGGNNAG